MKYLSNWVFGLLEGLAVGIVALCVNSSMAMVDEDELVESGKLIGIDGEIMPLVAERMGTGS